MISVGKIVWNRLTIYYNIPRTVLDKDLGLWAFSFGCAVILFILIHLWSFDSFENIGSFLEWKIVEISSWIDIDIFDVVFHDEMFVFGENIEDFALWVSV